MTVSISRTEEQIGLAQVNPGVVFLVKHAPALHQSNALPLNPGDDVTLVKLHHVLSGGIAEDDGDLEREQLHAGDI